MPINASFAAALLAGLSVAALAAPVRAADFELAFKSCAEIDFRNPKSTKPTDCTSSPDPIRRGWLTFRMTGEIAPADIERFSTLYKAHVLGSGSFGSFGDGSFVTVLLSGEKGDHEAGIALGQFFLENHIHTRIAAKTSCAGACALAFMGGHAMWGRHVRSSVERRLEAGGALAFASPFADFDPANGAAVIARLRSLQNYAIRTAIPPVLVGKMLKLKTDDRFAIDDAFWAKVAGVTIEGATLPNPMKDENYLSACYASANWNYGIGGEFVETPTIALSNPGNGLPEAEIVHRGKGFVLVTAVVSMAGYDYWCAINTSAQKITVPRSQIKALLGKIDGRHTLRDRNVDEDVVLRPREVYYSKPNLGMEDTAATNDLSLLAHPPETRLDAIADPAFKRDLLFYPE